ncbi:hypothetical protein Poli38472_006175 [Pythium oligandrum]|uniref:Uncharacterized protein n=1 Tax=Pythium oligandrum TaxID=41045 RepID=A0A8K1CRV7_PYTOL|nr:hypothetical protein Poli38472_006175 [Pythium oligandrum]|eukprot:TMW68707.1 hypothetical protein Poli38472_006175 [Pythium oligandrum]
MVELGARQEDALHVLVPSRDFWYVLVDEKCEAYCGMRPNRLRFSTRISKVDRVLDSVLELESRLLEGVTPFRLGVYANKSALREDEQALDPDDLTVGLGLRVEDPVVILVLSMLYLPPNKATENDLEHSRFAS